MEYVGKPDVSKGGDLGGGGTRTKYYRNIYKKKLLSNMGVMASTPNYKMKNYNLKEHKDWRKGILAKYNNKCIVCGSTNRLTAHHLITAHYKALSLHPDNGIPLCGTHHTRYGSVMSPHNENAMVFFSWLLINYPECIEFVNRYGHEAIYG